MQGKIDMGHARALLSLDGAKQIAVAQHVVAKKLSVRDAERMVQAALHPRKKAPVKPQRDILRLQESAADRLGAKVNIRHGTKGTGKMVIEYKSLDQLDGILSILGISEQQE